MEYNAVIEKTCKCLDSVSINGFEYKAGHEYQVDIYPLWNCVYNDGGWKNYVFFVPDDFKRYFKVIE